jgi:hypothetical protein
MLRRVVWWLLTDVGQYLSYYTAQHPRRQPSSLSAEFAVSIVNSNSSNYGTKYIINYFTIDFFKVATNKISGSHVYEVLHESFVWDCRIKKSKSKLAPVFKLYRTMDAYRAFKAPDVCEWLPSHSGLFFTDAAGCSLSPITDRRMLSQSHSWPQDALCLIAGRRMLSQSHSWSGRSSEQNNPCRPCLELNIFRTTPSQSLY